MKFMVIAVWDVDKGAELAKVTEKVDAAPPSGYKPLARYLCLAHPFAGFPTGTGVSVLIAEAESAEAIITGTYPAMLAGADINVVPVLEIPIARATRLEKKARGTAK
jgi:hypothetical protein